MTIRSMIDFVVGFVRDPNSKDGSSARLCALLFAIMACVVACTHIPNAGVAAVVTAFVGGGTVALLSRKKSDGSGPDGGAA